MIRATIGLNRTPPTVSVGSFTASSITILNPVSVMQLGLNVRVFVVGA